MRTCKSGKIKIKANNNHEKKKNRDLSNHYSNNNIDSEQTFNDFIRIEDDYKIKYNKYNYSNQKCSQFDKTIKIDWSLANHYIINNRKNIKKDIFLNSKNNEKENSSAKDQDICNFENDIIYNSNEKVSPKIKNNKNKRKINKNRNYIRSTGYNPCTGEVYTYNSDQRSSKNQSKNNFRNNLDISSNHNTDEINENIGSKMITVHNSDYFKDFNDNSEPIKINNDNNNYFSQKDNINSFQPFSGNFNSNLNKIKDVNKNIIKNIPKRKTETSNTIKINVISPKYNKTIKEQNNLNIKSLNMESSLTTQSRIKSSQKRNGPLIEFLSQINMMKYLNSLDNNGFDDINLLIDQAKKGNIVKDHELKEAGINIPGDRAKFIIRIN